MKYLLLIIALLSVIGEPAFGEVREQVVDIPTRSGVSQRFLLITPETPKVAAILFAGGHGGLQILPNALPTLEVFVSARNMCPTSKLQSHG